MYALGISGSPRKGGNTELLIKEVLTELKDAGWETELEKVGGTAIRGCIACKECFENKDNKCSIVALMAGASFVIQQAVNVNLRAELSSPWWAGFFSYRYIDCDWAVGDFIGVRSLWHNECATLPDHHCENFRSIFSCCRSNPHSMVTYENE